METRKPFSERNAVAVIGKGMIIKGSIWSKQDLYIDGEVDGVLEVENYHLTIGPNGKAEASAKARDLDVLGTIHGDVDSSGTISIRKGGKLVGDIRTAGIVIEDGAYFKGGVDIVTRREQPVPAGEV